jgi:prepilin-type N-terminal cleavage/methylation domain-containing protein
MKKNGFSLVEISIVLVIVSLLIGAGLKLADFIRAFKVSSVVKEVELINTAFQSFNLKYKCKGDANVNKFFLTPVPTKLCDCSKTTEVSCLPCYAGNCPNTGCLTNTPVTNLELINQYVCLNNTKTALVSSASNADKILVNAARNMVNVAVPGDFLRATTFIQGASGNGDGDALIDLTERALATEHLSRSGMIDLNYIANTSFVVGQNSIGSNLNKNNVGYHFGSNTTIPIGSNNPNLLILGANSSGAIATGTLNGGILNENEAFQIDSKLDNSNIANGKVIGLDSVAGTCVGSGNDRNCRMQFWLDPFDINAELDNEDIRNIQKNKF